MRVLLVENNEDLAEAISKLFEATPGVEMCSVVYDAPTALLEAERLKPDLVVLDQFLDGIETGINVAPKLKERFPNLKIVLYTGFDLAFEAAREPSVDAYLPKGKLKELFSIVQDLGAA